MTRLGIEPRSPGPLVNILLTRPMSCSNIVGPYSLFCAAVRKDSVSLFGFPFLGHIQVFPPEISSVCHLKYSSNHFSYNFCFEVIVVLLIFVLFLLGVIRPFLLFYIVVLEFLYWYIKAIVNVGASSLCPSFLDTYHHGVVPPARISLTLSHHFSLSFIASGWSSGLHSVSSRSCCMYVRAGRPAFARPYVGVHRSTSL